MKINKSAENLQTYYPNPTPTILSIRVNHFARLFFLSCLFFLADKGVLQHQFTEKLSSLTPRPQNTHPLNQTEVNDWINAHSENRDLATKFINCTQHINQETFEKGLQKSVKKRPFNREVHQVSKK